VKYVLDFYQGKPNADLPASIYLDIRPELTWAGAWDRMRMAFRKSSTDNHIASSIALPAGHPPIESSDYKSLPEGHPPLPTSGAGGSHPHAASHSHGHSTLPPGHPPINK